MKYSPVALFVYNRPWHTKMTIEALKKNKLASKTELFIFSDAARNEEQRKNVEEIRQYLYSIKGFSKVHIIKREKNLGLAKSILTGVTEVLNENNSIIVLEDDIVTSKKFLWFMNNALQKYEKDKRIGSISGFSFPPETMKIPESYTEDIYFSVRPSSWGWATWRDRWSDVDWEIKDYKKFRYNLLERSKFNMGGSDLSQMLDAQKSGKIDSWAIRWAYYFYKKNLYCVYPIVSFVDNIGNDDSGVHSKSSNLNIYKNKKLNSKDVVKFLDELYIDNELKKNFKKVYSKDIKYYIRKIIFKVRNLF